jgi:hypothetical protein
MYNLLIHLDISKNYLSSLSAMGVESFEALELQGGVVKKGSEKSGFEPPGVKHNI